MLTNLSAFRFQNDARNGLSSIQHPASGKANFEQLPRLFVAAMFALLIQISPAFGQSALERSANVIPIPRSTGPIELDGMSDEPSWEAVDPWIPNQYEPDNGSPSTERTEFRITYDDDYIYFSLRGYDSDPNGIRSNTLYRDGLGGSDHFEIMLDTYNDNETAFVFTTTPAGIRKDATISNDASGGGIRQGGWINGDFNTFWDVATRITPEGWFAEMRVPFSSLRFQDVDGKVTMGITLQRKVARKTERLVFPDVPSVADWAFLKPSLAQKIQLEGIKPHNPVYITPYALGGLGHVNRLNEAGSAYARTNNNTGDLGVDLKYSLTNNITADVTVNTDFAQAEADDQQVNLTRFSLFIPEKRQFFQERASIFDFRTGGLSRLFHSRRIGLTDAGAPVPLIGGVRLVGRMKLWDMGLMNIQSAESGGLPSENFGVLRLRRQVINPYSYTGGMITTRAGNDGSYNFAYGLDGVFRLFREDYLTLQWAQTFDDTEVDSISGLNNSRFTAEIARRTRVGWGYSSLLAWAGEFYNPGIGFTQRNDFTLTDNTLSYTWLPGESSSLIWHQLGVTGAAFLRNSDGSFESVEVGPQWEFSQKSGAGGTIEAKMQYEDLDVPFALSRDVSVPAEAYTFYWVAASYHVSHTSLVQLRPGIEAGSFYDGWQFTVNASPVWYVSKHLSLSGDYVYNRIRFPDRDQKLDVHIARLRVATALDTKLSTSAFIQYNSVTHSISTNVRFRYNFREGNDLWLVYNEGVNTDRYRQTPYLPVTDNRTLLFKYTYTFQL